MDSGSGLTWNIAVDGSDSSLDAFNIVFNELRRDDDYIVVSHVFTNKKDYLPMRFKSDNIKQDYESLLIGTHQSKWQMVWENLDKDLTTKEHVNRIAQDVNADIMALGYVGRKGPKEDITILGSAVEYIAHHPVCPILITKSPERRSDKDNGAFRWLVCSDGSEKSYKALRETIKIMDRDTDELVVLVVALAAINVDNVREDTDNICEDEGVKYHSFESIDRDSDEQTHEAITDYINLDDSPYVDFVTVANQGSGYVEHAEPKYFGKVAKKVLCVSKANVLLVF